MGASRTFVAFGSGWIISGKVTLVSSAPPGGDGGSEDGGADSGGDLSGAASSGMASRPRFLLETVTSDDERGGAAMPQYPDSAPSGGLKVRKPSSSTELIEAAGDRAEVVA